MFIIDDFFNTFFLFIYFKQISLNPEVANLVKSLAANLTSTDSVPNTLSSILVTSSINNHKTENTYKSTISTLPTYSIQEHTSTKPCEPPRSPDSNINQISADSNPNQTLQKELWEVLENSYPELNVRELSAERIRELLEPLKDQLVSKGIFQFRNMGLLRPRYAHPHNEPSYDKNMSHPAYRSFRNPPPLKNDFLVRSHPSIRSPISNGYNRPSFGGPMHYPHQGPPLHSSQPYRSGPNCNGPPISLHGGPTSITRNSNRSRSSQPCRFFQQGACRNGASCPFSHSIR